MLKKITITLAIVAVAIIAFSLNGKFAFSYDGGAPAGYANDPASGNANCSACHGSATTVTGWITSNIPVAGYTPGTTYTITATSTGTGGNKGFEISPQSATGTFLGTLIAGTGTSLTGSNHYIISSGTGITTNPMSWTFTWTAPATGLGPVGFYGAFAIGHPGNTYITSYIVSENTSGITETSVKTGFSIYPNPVVDNMNISYTLSASSKVAINLYSLDGKKVAELSNKEQTSGTFTEKISIKDLNVKGIYFVELKTGDKTTLQKVVIY